MRFAFVPFGERAPPGAAACDGLVPGAAIDLSHWQHNRTPPHLKRDTSVEIALAFAAERDAHDVELATNNHFDTDGVLAVWTLLRPELAREHAAVIVAAAEVGDFDAWPSDERGFQLDAAIARLSPIGGDARRYPRVLDALDTLVPNLATREAEWGEAVRALFEVERSVADGLIAVERHGRIALFEHARGAELLPGPWLSRLAPPGTDRWLLASARDSGFRYHYELPRWTWADTVERPTITMPRRGPLRAALGAGWVIKGRQGMTGVIYTEGVVASRPRDVARILAEVDR